MLKRILFSIAQGMSHKRALRSYLHAASKKRHPSVLTIDPATLKSALMLDILVLDFDGVLAEHGAVSPKPEVLHWIRKVEQCFGVGRVYLLTNKPFAKREAFFKDHFPSMPFIKAKAKKPYPDGLLQIIEHSKVAPSKIALIDDRLLTGVLATCIAKTQAVYITRPFHNYMRHPRQEVFFSCLRALERFWVRMLVWR